MVCATWILVSYFFAASGPNSDKASDDKSPVLQVHNKAADRVLQQQPPEVQVQQNAIVVDQQPQTASKSNKEPENNNDQEDRGFLLPPREPDGLGEMGKPVKLTNLTAEQSKLMKIGWKNNAFNQYVSDMISIHRSLPDPRDKE